MLKGTETHYLFSRGPAPECPVQQGLPERHARRVYRRPLIVGSFPSKYVSPRKGLKGSVKQDTSESAFFCRAFLLSLWVTSLLAVARGGTLCQLGND